MPITLLPHGGQILIKHEDQSQYFDLTYEEAAKLATAIFKLCGYKVDQVKGVAELQVPTKNFDRQQVVPINGREYQLSEVVDIMKFYETNRSKFM